ncbi:hypothetical protein B296_00040354 [Ensete ventricosum]|uniref:Uncharacterized protein n=1 Tax=Ensete ventricosum TaxID=4639 RepID=A0A426ZL57_ENSVE|nr:hypothetical protein B296_00040354 [Ensete ventricosum]
MTIPNILAHGNSYEHCFVKKRDDHKLCTKSCAKSSFDRFLCTMSKTQNTGHFQHISQWEVVQARFRKKM